MLAFPPESDQSDPLRKSCRAFLKLKNWQVRKYRAAVEENKWYMGERLGREVAWEEAEKDFFFNDYYGCAREWRSEYCGNRCSFIDSCNLGQKFCNS